MYFASPSQDEIITAVAFTWKEAENSMQSTAQTDAPFKRESKPTIQPVRSSNVGTRDGGCNHKSVQPLGPPGPVARTYVEAEDEPKARETTDLNVGTLCQLPANRHANAMPTMRCMTT